MDIQYYDNSIFIKTDRFDLQKTFECGQCFRFERCDDGSYKGIAYGKTLTLTQQKDGVTLFGVTRKEFEDTFYNYFDLERDYDEIDRILEKDPVLRDIIPYSKGIRILNQQPFETVISFIISASNNIPRIKKIIASLCENFGENGQFPTPEKLAGLDLCDLAVIRAGFRDKYILDCAKKVASGEIDLDAIKTMTYAEASATLQKINGIGQKVADCSLLFGFGFMEAFPKDVWIKRILSHFYGVEDNKKLDFFGYDGIAQQYLFYYAINNHDIITEAKKQHAVQV
jgi:N-glycosylase/DNA lyase